MQQSAQDEAKSMVALAFAATVVVEPLDAWLTEDELETIVTASGISPAVFREVSYSVFEERRSSHNAPDQKLRPQSLDLTRLMAFAGSRYPPVFSMAAVERLSGA